MVEHYYNYWLVAISIIVACVASYTALTLSQRMILARQAGKKHFNWLFASATVMGTGIWSMHFVAMLAYGVDIEVRYRVDLTVLSVVFAILGTAISFWLVNLKRDLTTICASGTFMGMAIVSMHYTGMAAYHAGVKFHYLPLLVGVSVAIAIGASIVALWTIFKSAFGPRVQVGASVILGIAVSGMHYTGMAALNMQTHDHGDAALTEPLLWTFNTNYLAVITVGLIAVISIISYIAISNNVKLHEFMERENQTLRYANKMEAIGHLTGGIAHDFRNILTVMNSGIRLLEKGKPISEVTPLLVQTIQRGQFLAEQLLSFARQKPTNPKVVQVQEFLQENRMLLTGVLPPYVTLEMNTESDAVVLVDPDAFSLAIMNLVINSKDAMPDGGVVQITVDRESVSDKHFLYSTIETTGAFVHVTVSDNGTGMSQKVIDNLFQPFFTTKDNGKGSGLGLPQVHGFVQQSGGGIGVVSHLGKGTQVHILLPEHSHK